MKTSVRCAFTKLGDERVGRMVSQFGDRALLHDAAFVHQDDAIAEIRRLREIVRDENRCLLKTLEDFLQVLLQRARTSGSSAPSGSSSRSSSGESASARMRLTRCR